MARNHVFTWSVLHMLTLLCSVSSALNTEVNMTFFSEEATQKSANNVITYEDATITIYYNVTCDDSNAPVDNLTLQIVSESEYIARITKNTSTPLSGPCSDISGSFSVLGVRLGRADLKVSIDGAVVHNSYSVIVLRKRRVIDDVFRYGIIFLAVVLYVGFGCTVDLRVIKDILKKPVAPAVGILSQFLIMPLVGFSLGQMFGLSHALAFGLLTMACSPGGGSSNVWVNLLGGDLDLSITMTTVSTFFSLGMMPLWLYALGPFYLPSSDVAIPYLDIFRSLLTIVIPLAVGLVIRHFAPKVANKIARFVRPWSGLFIVYVLGFGTYVNLYMYEIMGQQAAQVIPSSILLPLLGYAFGFGAALVARRTYRQAITISIETGVQNASIPIIVLQGNFPQPEGDEAAVMPVATSLFYTLPILAAWLAYIVWKRQHPDSHTAYELDPEDAQQATATDTRKEPPMMDECNVVYHKQSDSSIIIDTKNPDASSHITKS